MVNKFPMQGYSPSKWTKWLVNRGDPNHLLTGMILQVPIILRTIWESFNYVDEFGWSDDTAGDDVPSIVARRSWDYFDFWPMENMSGWTYFSNFDPLELLKITVKEHVFSSGG